MGGRDGLQSHVPIGLQQIPVSPSSCSPGGGWEEGEVKVGWLLELRPVQSLFLSASLLFSTGYRAMGGGIHF